MNSRVSIMTIGVQTYENLQRLSGPKKDVERIKNILFLDNKIALFHSNPHIDLFDCDSVAFRESMNEYVMSRSAPNDILIIYYSGHGAIIQNSDYAFCFTDTQIHLESGQILPLSVISFSSIINSLKIANVIPVFIIDSCMSGKTGNLLVNDFETTTSILKKTANSSLGSNYAIFCSSSSSEVANEDSNGGIFSTCLHNVAYSGIKTKDLSKSQLTFTDLYQLVTNEIERSIIDSSPLLYIGEAFDSFPFIKNIAYEPSKFSLGPSMKTFLLYLWDNGKNTGVKTSDIAKNFVPGVYCNNKKLSYPVWNLIKDTPDGRRVLTNKGVDFIQGNITIPKTIVLESSNTYVESPNTKYVGIDDL